MKMADVTLFFILNHVSCNIKALVHVFTCVLHVLCMMLNVHVKSVIYLQPISVSVALTQHHDCIFYDIVSDHWTCSTIF